MIDEMTVTRLVLASPQECHDLVTDLENYPNWASGVNEVNVLESDEQGRSTQVTFRAGAFGRSANYTLAYNHTQAPGRISWELVKGDIVKKLEGFYEFEPAPEQEGATMLTFRLAVELAIPLPGFVKRRAESRISHVAIDDMQKQVESGSAFKSARQN